MHRNDFGTQSLYGGGSSSPGEPAAALNASLTQEILRANASVKTAAELATKYRKNVQYNLEATKGNLGA